MKTTITPPKNKKKLILIICAAVVILALLTTGIVFALRPQKAAAPATQPIATPEKQETTPSSTPVPTTTPTPTPKPTVPPTPTKKSTPTPTPTPTGRPYISPTNKEVSRGNTSRKQIAITFDGGSSAAQTPQILKILKDNNLHVTMFTTGKWAEQNPALIKQIIADGHSLGNHTYDHQDLTKLTDTQIADEFSRTETIVKNLTGTSTKPYFRPPYGARNQHVWDYAASLGYQSIYWTTDALDWKAGQTYNGQLVDNDFVKNRILDNAKNGSIILMHLGDDITPAILQETITQLQAKGYSIVRLEDVLKP